MLPLSSRSNFRKRCFVGERSALPFDVYIFEKMVGSATEPAEFPDKARCVSLHDEVTTRTHPTRGVLLPENLNFSGLIEPLKTLYRDEEKTVGWVRFFGEPTIS